MNHQIKKAQRMPRNLGEAVSMYQEAETNFQNARGALISTLVDGRHMEYFSVNYSKLKRDANIGRLIEG